MCNLNSTDQPPQVDYIHYLAERSAFEILQLVVRGCFVVQGFAESLQHRVEVLPYMEVHHALINIYVWK